MAARKSPIAVNSASVAAQSSTKGRRVAMRRRRYGAARRTRQSVGDTVRRMSEGLDVEAMIQRFKDRAHAVKDRPLPPVAGAERARFVRQAQIDYQDFAIIGDAEATIDDGILVLRVDLRP